jgi:hypothetical protein
MNRAKARAKISRNGALNPLRPLVLPPPNTAGNPGSASTIDAPRQKLMKLSATVVATTTLGFRAEDARGNVPSWDDIYPNYFMLFSDAHALPPAQRTG